MKVSHVKKKPNKIFYSSFHQFHLSKCNRKPRKTKSVQSFTFGVQTTWVVVNQRLKSLSKHYCGHQQGSEWWRVSRASSILRVNHSASLRGMKGDSKEELREALSASPALFINACASTFNLANKMAARFNYGPGGGRGTKTRTKMEASALIIKFSAVLKGSSASLLSMAVRVAVHGPELNLHPSIQSSLTAT